jgi:hypothetical protein
VRFRIFGIVALIASAASPVVVVVAGTSAGGLPAYTNGYPKWRESTPGRSRSAARRARTAA